MSKPKVIKDYEKLTDEVKEQIKLVFPMGYSNHLITFTNRNGEIKKGLPFETEEYYYLIRMSEAKAKAMIVGDEDYDENGNLKKSVREKYEDKHDEEDYLNDQNSNMDNDLGMGEDAD
jgi:hypothetical protein